jgi:UDP-N-acetylmuramoylalanine--D-glutamate ligase
VTGAVHGRGSTALVAGLGISGAAAARVLLARGARVLLTDAAEPSAVAELVAAGGTWLGALDTVPDGTDLVVTSPGWRPDAPLLADAARRGVEVIGEPELAWRLRLPGPDGTPAPWLVVTGTNGKTTTVTMLEAILLAAGRRAVAAGNVGRPLIEVVTARQDDGTPAFDVVAVELSSFQLHWASSIAPAAAVVLNVADDHTDWHGSFAAYRDAKASILARTPVAVADAGDPVAAALVVGHAHPVTVTLDEPGPGQLGVRSGALVDRAFAGDPAGELRRPSPGPSAPPPRPSPAGCPASGAGHTATSSSGPSPGSTTSTTARRPTRTRPVPRSPRTHASCGSPAGCSRAPTSIRWSPRSPTASPASSCWAATGP